MSAGNEDQKSTLKKVLPKVAIGLGILLLLTIVLRQYVQRAPGASVAPAPLANPSYGQATLSGIPYYDQYQSKYAPTDKARTANPAPSGLTYQDAHPQVPHSIIKNGKNLYTDCAPGCNGLVGCTDSSSANFDPNATCGCINCCVPRTYGCLDPNASTYNPFANTHDNLFCKYAAKSAPAKIPPAALDCVAQLQANPDAAAAAGCTAPIGGCIDPKNAMYNPQANYNDGTCVYGESATAASLAPHDSQYLGALKGCGDAWDLRKGYSRGPTTY